MTPLRRYYRGTTLAGVRDVQAGTTYVPHFDHQGTTQCLTNAAGTVTDRFASDAWGVQVKRTGSSINRQWYVGNWGYYRQKDWQSDYVRARWLDNARGRWLSVDPEPFEPPYGYAINRPALAMDASGRKAGPCKHPPGRPVNPNNCYCGYQADAYLKDELRRYDLWVSAIPAVARPSNQVASELLTATFENMCYKARYALGDLYCWAVPRASDTGNCAYTLSIGNRCVRIHTLGNITFVYTLRRVQQRFPRGTALHENAQRLYNKALENRTDPEHRDAYKFGQFLSERSPQEVQGLQLDITPYRGMWTVDSLTGCRTRGHRCAVPIPVNCRWRFAAAFLSSAPPPSWGWHPIEPFVGPKREPEFRDSGITGRNEQYVDCAGRPVLVPK